MNAAHQTASSLPFPPMQTGGVARFLQVQAAARPDHPAAIYEGTTYSYNDLYLRAQKITAELTKAGVRHGDRVGVLFPNHPDYIAAFFGTAGLGAVVVPINPLLKSEEIAHILADSDARAVIVHERQSHEVERALSHLTNLTHVFVVAYDRAQHGLVTPSQIKSVTLLSEALTNHESHHQNHGWNDEIKNDADLAVLVYTSGTTGKPKGAMLTHSNLLSSVSMAHHFLLISSEDRFLALLPLCHIYGLTVVMLGVFAKGGTLIVLEKFEPPAALRLIESERVTVLPAVPAIYQFLLMELEKNKYDLSSLRVCLSGAAAMPVELFPRLEKSIPAPLVEGYGLTEVSSIVSVNPIGKQKKGSVGVPMVGVEVAIVDKSGAHLSPGRKNIGEIAVKGPHVMRGYYEQPEASAECLRNGWFFTGDLGYRDEDGYLYIVGRTKELIIRGGQNIYPREVEDVIMRVPEVIEVAVIGVPDPYMGERVKAVVVLRKDKTLSEDQVKAFCSEHLADYKVPRLVEFTDLLPRNSTGKVLKRLLQQAI